MKEPVCKKLYPTLYKTYSCTEYILLCICVQYPCCCTTLIIIVMFIMPRVTKHDTLLYGVQHSGVASCLHMLRVKTSPSGSGEPFVRGYCVRMVPMSLMQYLVRTRLHIADSLRSSQCTCSIVQMCRQRAGKSTRVGVQQEVLYDSLI